MNKAAGTPVKVVVAGKASFIPEILNKKKLL